VSKAKAAVHGGHTHANNSDRPVEMSRSTTQAPTRISVRLTAIFPSGLLAIFFAESNRALMKPSTIARRSGHGAIERARVAATLGLTDVRTAIRRSAYCGRAVADGRDRRQHGRTGANAAVYSAVDALLVRAPPGVAGAARLVDVYTPMARSAPSSSQDGPTSSEPRPPVRAAGGTWRPTSPSRRSAHRKSPSDSTAITKDCGSSLFHVR
jgi:hypothetical protein